MSDPHVEALYYSADSECEGVEYRNPAPVEWDAEKAHYQLEEGKLTAWPKGHYATVEEAKEALLPELEAWQAYVDLTKEVDSLRFRYKDADIIDRAPPQPGHKIVPVRTANVSARALAAGNYKVVRNYPEPPLFTRVDTEIVRDLMARYRQYREGRELFSTMAYAALTRIIVKAGNKEAAAQRYNISLPVLKKLSRLTSTGQGEPLSVRKFTQDGTVPMSPEDQQWLQKAVVAIIIQVAAVEAGDNPKKLTMASVN